jgi:hypothetical protein
VGRREELIAAGVALDLIDAMDQMTEAKKTVAEQVPPHSILGLEKNEKQLVRVKAKMIRSGLMP